MSKIEMLLRARFKIAKLCVKKSLFCLVVYVSNTSMRHLSAQYRAIEVVF